MKNQTVAEQELSRALDFAYEITRAFPNLKVNPEEVCECGGRISLWQMENSADPINGFNDKQRGVYVAALIQEMYLLLNKLGRATQTWHNSDLVHLINLALFRIEAANPADIAISLQCDWIDALAKELSIAKSKSHLTNDELIEAAGAEEIDAQIKALRKEIESATDEERNALWKKVDPLYEQRDQKIAKFLFDPATALSRLNGHD